MNYYKNELHIINRANIFRERRGCTKNIKDMASNDYLGLSTNKKNLKKAFKLLLKEDYYTPKSSVLVNGYSGIHNIFEQELCKANNFEDGIVVGSGFLANISLIESMVRKKDFLFIDEEYHASGMMATKLTQGTVISFAHNDINDLKQKIKKIKKEAKPNRIIIAIEGVYSMLGDIAPKEIDKIASKYDAILIVDEAHSSGVIGDNLLGWYDYHNIKIKPNHIKMGTLGKAYGSYGAYILASKHIVSFLVNRAKPIIYSTAPSLFDIALGLVNFRYIQKHKLSLKTKIDNYKKIAQDILNQDINSMIVPVSINDNNKVIEIQQNLIKKDFMVGAIRQPTVSSAILRVILKLDINSKDIKKIFKHINKEINQCK